MVDSRLPISQVPDRSNVGATLEIEVEIVPGSVAAANLGTPADPTLVRPPAPTWRVFTPAGRSRRTADRRGRRTPPTVWSSTRIPLQ